MRDKIIEGFRNPQRALTYLAPESSRKFFHEVNKLYYSHIHNSCSVDIFMKDWDNMIILDACRYDLFEPVANLPGHTKKIDSMGSNTREWLRANFHNKDLRDTVYVTANPMLTRIWNSINCSLCAVVNVWEDDGWDNRYNTVLPSTTTEYALTAYDSYPNKKLIIHFIQPHFPFLTEELQLDKVTPDPEVNDGDFWGIVTDGTYADLNETKISKQDIWTAYRSTLEKTLPHVNSLIGSLTGKTIVTADHGEMLGERGFPFPIKYYGHPSGLRRKPLIEVPYHVAEFDERRKIQSGTATSFSDSIDEDTITKRLNSLGYT